jgi:hypothetical protein
LAFGSAALFVDGFLTIGRRVLLPQVATINAKISQLFAEARMMRIAKWMIVVNVSIALLEIPIGSQMGSGALHPLKSEMTATLAADARHALEQAHGSAADFLVDAKDGVQLRGWSAVSNLRTADQSSDSWVLLFHGQGDNRAGMLGSAGFLLRAGQGRRPSNSH